MFLILLFKLLTQFPFVCFVSISILSLLPFSILSSPSPQSLLSLLINSLSPLLHSIHQWHIFLHTVSHHDIIFFLIMHLVSLKKTKFLWLSSNLSYPKDLKKQWLPFLSSLFSLSSFPLASLPSLLALLINSLSS